jgi:micrococcal nuclease
MPRFRRTRWRELSIAAAVLALAGLRLLTGGPQLVTSTSAAAGKLQPGIYEVERIVDGDTLVLKHGRMRIRLQGVDTPETVQEDTPDEPWGPEASAFTKTFVDEARGRLRVEIDGEPLDQHGRYLAFLWHGDRLLNEELVRNGLARATLQYDFSERKKDRLRQAQREAKRATIGIWSSPSIEGRGEGRG